jgi:rod shape-determining protein MreD
MPSKVVLRVGLVVLSAAVLQRGFFAQVRVAQVAADVLLVMAVLGGLIGGPERGSVVGFVCGLAMDLLVGTPLGLIALTYCIVGFVAGRYQLSVTRSSRARLMATVGIASALGYGLLATLGYLLGQRNMVSGHLVVVVVVIGAVNALLAPPAGWVMRWALDEPKGRRLGVSYGP